jgi:type VI secretion system secreted protein VgrG
MAIPRTGQEVVVEFIEGDPDRPIITGRVYNGTVKPPYSLPENATRTIIKTNSSKGGGGFNELRFEDKKGKEQVFIHAERNRDLRVKKDNLEFIGGEEHIIVKKDRFDKVDGDIHLKLGGDMNQQVGESASLKVGQNIQQKAGMRISQEAVTEIHLKAGMNVIIEAPISITLKAGGGFITVGPAGVTISGTPVLINSGGSPSSGAGCSPTAPKIAREADKAVPGKVDKIHGGGRPKPKGPPSPTALVLKQASQSGTPFCEICNK